MNKSDFISDAVALDLGKSGVKVAETLEMQIGDEWWRLINSSEPMTIKGFVKRIERGVDIEEGEMDVSPISTTFETVGEGTMDNQKENTCSMLVRVKQGEGAPDILRLVIMHRSLFAINNNGKIRAFLYQTNGAHEKTYSETTEYRSFVKSISFWDYINQRAILVYLSNTLSGNVIFYVDIAGTTVNSASRLSSIPNISMDVKNFLEIPEKIYSLFRTVDSISVKQTIPTDGLSPNTLAKSVCSATGATVISVASNYRNEEAFLFYSRTHESVGVAWVDRTNGKLYYTVESDGWLTAYELSSTFSNDNSILSYFGNMVLGGDVGGEYYVAGRENYRSGILTKPIGFSFPANLNIMGVAASVDGNIRIFGMINTMLYVYLVNSSTMTILAENSYDTGNTISNNFQPVKIAESSTRELYYLNYCTHNSDKNVIKALLVNIEKSTNSILWVWGYGNTAWQDTTAWSVLAAAPGRPWHQIIRKYREDVAFLSFGGALTWNSIGFRFIPSGEVLACDTPVELRDLIRSYPESTAATTTAATVNTAIKFGLKSRTAQNALTHGETANTFFFADYSNSSNGGTPLSFHFDKITKQFVGAYLASNTEFANVGKQLCGTSYNSAYDCYMYNSSDGTREDMIGVDQTSIKIYDPSMQLLETFAYFSGVSLATQSAYFIPNEENDVRQFYSVLPTSKKINCYIFNLAVGGGYSLYNRELTLLHNASHSLVGTKDNTVLFISNCIDGEIAYTQLRANEGLYKKALAIKSTDFTESYSLNLGRTPIGGEHSVFPSGSWLLSRDYANRVILTDTGTNLNDYVGGTPPENTGSVVYLYEDRDYIPYPFAREGIKVELSNISKTTKVTIPETQTDLIRTMIASGTDFRGSRCILRRLFPDHVDEGSDIALLDGYIQDWSYSPEKKGILFTVSKTLIDVGATFPKRLMNMGCSHVFKGVRCGYLGADGICTKTKTDCTVKGSVNNFGGFPWVAARQRRIMWR